MGELGCGSGIGGLGAALVGNHVILTDKAEIQARTQSNVDQNMENIQSVGGSCSYVDLDWKKDPSEWSTAIPKHLDLVIASDVVWATPFIKPFLAVVKALFERAVKENNGRIPEVLFSNKTRDPKVEAAFFDACPEYGISVDSALHSGGFEESDPYYHARVTIFRLRPI